MNGNLEVFAGKTYQYDQENKLIAVADGSTTEIEYDPLGRIFEVRSGSNIKQFLFDSDALVAEFNNTTGNSPSRGHVHGDQVDRPWVRFDGSNVDRSNAIFLHTNHQGSIVAHSNDQGQV